MLDVKDIGNQSFIDSDEVTPQAAADMARTERWAPHVEDGLDAFARVAREAEAAKWVRVIAEAGSNPAFRARLEADPVGAVRGFGIAVPAGLELRIVQNSSDVRHVVLPAPAFGGLPEPEAKAIATALAFGTTSTLLPQCWADTWKASKPFDPGMPQPKPVQNPSR